MADELDEIKRLSPEARIRRLKELEEARKKEISEAEKMIKSSEEEIAMEENIRREVPIPQMRAVDIDQLFTREEKQMFEAKQGPKPKGIREVSAETKAAPLPEAMPLEQAVAMEQLKVSEEQLREHQQYLQQLAKAPFEQIQDEAKRMYDEFRQQGYLNREQQERANELYQAVQMKEEAARRGEYDAAREVMEQIDPARRMLHILGHWYQEVRR